MSEENTHVTYLLKTEDTFGNETETKKTINADSFIEESELSTIVGFVANHLLSAGFHRDTILEALEQEIDRLKNI